MYRTIDASFWTDPKVREFKKDERYLLLYLITNPHTHVSGIYYLPWLIAEHETSLPRAELNTAADTLSKMGVALFDRPKEIVWVVNMFSFQGAGQKNTLSAAYHLAEDCHKSFLIEYFLKRYPKVETPYRNRVSIPYTVLATPDLRSLISEQEKIHTPKESHPGKLKIDLPELVQTYGEFGWVRLTAEQHEKLSVKLNGSLDGYIQRFDHWVNEAPDAKANGIKRRDRHAYESISAWAAKDQKAGSPAPVGSRPQVPDKNRVPDLASQDLAMQQFLEQEALEEQWARDRAKKQQPKLPISGGQA